MDDTISRQAAIAEFSCCELTPDGGIDANYAIDFLKNMPSAQPEIILCKDCKYWEQEGICEGYCYETELDGIDEDHFCAYAVRRNDERFN